MSVQHVKPQTGKHERHLFEEVGVVTLNLYAMLKLIKG
jgi:hypothetical protein